MRHDEETLVAFLEGTLAPEEAQEFDAHLLGCESCWAALHEDRAGRDALESLREAAPPELRDRVRLAVQAASSTIGPRPTSHRQQSRGRTRILAGVVAGVVAIAAASALSQDPGDLPRRGIADPPPVAAVVELARLGGATPAGPALEHGTGAFLGSTLELGGQKVRLARHLVDGREVLVATSDRAFHMPADAHPLRAGPGVPWLARRGDVGLACFSRPVHMLIAGRLPAERLAQIGPLLFPR